MRKVNPVGTVGSVPSSFTLAHLSDTHIGYEAYKALSAGGENQRSVDVAKAFVASVDEIIDLDPALVIHSGDVADRTQIPIRMMLLIRRQFERLAGIRPDGTRRQLVVVAGNHELPRNRKEACFLELFRGTPGIHIVTRDYEVISFDGTGISAGCDPVLSDVDVHCLPHDALKEVDFDQVRPREGRVNILSSHGVAGGSELYVRSLGREFAIPTEVLARNWDYGALGHWHKQGPVPIAATGAMTRGAKKKQKTTDDEGFVPGEDYLDVDENADRGRIWYAGSTENCGFGDLKDNGTRRGWLQVTVDPAGEPKVRRRYVPIRAMFRLPLLDVTGLDPDAITEQLVDRIRAADLRAAVVSQIVEGVTRDVFSLVDLAKVRAAASHALHYDVTVRYSTTTRDGSAESRGLGDIDAILVERATAILADHERAGALTVARTLLTKQLERAGRSTEAAGLPNDASASPAPGADDSPSRPEEVHA